MTNLKEVFVYDDTILSTVCSHVNVSGVHWSNHAHTTQASSVWSPRHSAAGPYMIRFLSVFVFFVIFVKSVFTTRCKNIHAAKNR